MKRVRGGSGLGDSIYLRPVVEYYSVLDDVTVCTGFPDIFIGLNCKVEPFNRENIDVLAHYTGRKYAAETNQWQDICISAKVPINLPMSFKWSVQNPVLVDLIKTDAAGRPIVLVHGGRTPMGRTDGFGAELLPAAPAFDAVLDVLSECFLIRIGKGPDLYPLDVDADLNGSTSVADVLDIGSICAGVIGQCSFAVPLAEALDKPLLVVWSAAGLRSRQPYVSSIAPNKVLSKPTSQFLVDEWLPENIEKRAAEFLQVVKVNS